MASIRRFDCLTRLGQMKAKGNPMYAEAFEKKAHAKPKTHATI